MQQYHFYEAIYHATTGRGFDLALRFLQNFKSITLEGSPLSSSSLLPTLLLEVWMFPDILIVGTGGMHSWGVFMTGRSPNLGGTTCVCDQFGMFLPPLAYNAHSKNISITSTLHLGVYSSSLTGIIYIRPYPWNIMEATFSYALGLLMNSGEVGKIVCRSCILSMLYFPAVVACVK